MEDVFVIGGLRVLVDQGTGRVVSVLDHQSGAPARLLWTAKAIADASAAAHAAWASTIECCA